MSRIVGAGLALAITLAMAAAPTTASADERAPPKKGPREYVHDGLYLRGGVGAGRFYSSSTITGTTPDKRTFSGTTLALEVAAGGSPSPGFAIGGAYLIDRVYGLSGKKQNGDAVDTEGVAFNLSALGPFIDVYPDPETGLHFQFLFAYAALNVGYDTRTTQDPDDSATGLAFVLGAGYEGWLGPQWSLGGLLRLAYAPLSVDRNSFSSSSNGRISVEALAPSLLVTVTRN